MVSISGNNIVLTRGDSLFLQITLEKNGETYVPETGSSIRFAMKQRYSDPDTDVVLNKNVPIDTLLLELLPEDTKTLPMKQSYVYDIQLTDANSHVYTFISGTLTIGEEVL